MMWANKQLSLFLLCASAVFIGGCGTGVTAPATPTSGAVLRGKVYGGQQPITGARVYLLAAGTSGYGGASVSLLDPAVTGQSDSIGAYVMTGAGGSFSISGDYKCNAGSQAYLYALGGDPGTGQNSAAGMMALLGSCPAAGTFASTLQITLNEVTTIAGAYAVAGYATDAVHVSSSGTALAKTGVANAFSNATNLVDLASGGALATTPGGNGVVPQTELNTLGDILASCVNSANTSSGGASAACSALFALATSDGTTTGTQPTDTASAAINIAHHPGPNVNALYAMSGGLGAPFEPVLAAAPNDFSVRLAFSSTYEGTNGLQPNTLAVDGSGNIWAVEPYCQVTAASQKMGQCVASSQIFEFNPLGVPASATGFVPTPYFLQSPNSVAVDATSSNLWITDGSAYGTYNNQGYPPLPAAVVKVSIAQSVGVLRVDATSVPNLITPSDAAVDASGNVWVADMAGYLTHLNGSTGSVMTQVNGHDNLNTCPSCGPSFDFYSVAMQPGVNGNVWATSYQNGYASVYSPAGVQQAGSPFFAVSGGWGSFSEAIDAGGNVWLPGFFGMESLASTGSEAPGSPFPIIGNRHSTLSTLGEGMAIDGDGDAWMTTEQNTVFELNNQGTILTGANGYVCDPAVSGADALVVDGSGNVWYNGETAYGNAALYELVGAAAPVVTPVAYGVQTNQLGARP